MIIEEKLYNKMPPELQLLFNELPNPQRDEVVGVFPQTKGEIGRAGRTPKPKEEKFGMFGLSAKVTETGFKDSGSASRFFYCAKSSKSERNGGLEGMEETLANKNGMGLGRQTSLDKRKQQIGDDLIRMNNNHPTVKPIALMKYLIKLVTPPKGVVLDPFTGSGSTLCAAVILGFNYIGIDMEEEYVKIAQARVKYWAEKPQQEKLL